MIWLRGHLGLWERFGITVKHKLWLTLNVVNWIPFPPWRCLFIIDSQHCSPLLGYFSLPPWATNFNRREKADLVDMENTRRTINSAKVVTICMPLAYIFTLCLGAIYWLYAPMASAMQAQQIRALCILFGFVVTVATQLYLTFHVENWVPFPPWRCLFTVKHCLPLLISPTFVNFRETLGEQLQGLK